MPNASTAAASNSNCFDLMRVLAATAVLYSHSFALLGMPEPQPIAGQSWGSLAVAAFFAISGYLVCSSWTRDPSVSRFAVRRALRIIPGLFVVVFVTAVLLGPALSSLSVPEYFDDNRTIKYFFSTLLFLSVPELPGLFEHNPFPHANNGSLWTLRYEILMYAVLAVVGAGLPARYFKSACVTLLGGLVVCWFGLTLYDIKPYKIPLVWRLGTELYGDRLCVLGIYFFTGACLHLFRERLRLSPLLAATLCILPVLLNNADWVTPLLWLAIPYGAITLAYRAPASLRVVSIHDYSYGIYIYAFPVQQVVVSMLPQAPQRWLLSLLITLVVTVILAALSWHWVEKPMLRLKGKFLRSA